MLSADLLMTMPDLITITNTALGPSSVPSDTGHGDDSGAERNNGTLTLAPSPPSTNTSGESATQSASVLRKAQ